MFLANVARAVNSARLPRLARKTLGRAPVLASIRSEASRRCSNGSARRIGCQRGIFHIGDGRADRHGLGVEHLHRAPRQDSGSRWCRSAHPCGARSRPRARRGPWRPCPGSTRAPAPAGAPPAASISWNSAQAARQSFSVRSSMPPEPAAGSATLATLDSSISRSWVLRATRRAKRSGRPSAEVNGSTRHGIGAADARRKRGDGGAQHVHPRIAPASSCARRSRPR